jgi:superfamily II DNA/RNA helicase
MPSQHNSTMPSRAPRSGSSGSSRSAQSHPGRPHAPRPSTGGRPNTAGRSNSAGHSNSAGRSRPARDRAAAPVNLDFADTSDANRPLIDNFAELGLASALITMLSERGITVPTAIQARTMPDALAGHDVLGRAQTGSGKTLAFGLPMLTRLAASRTQRVSLRPRGLVLVPTRELARQVADELEAPAHTLGLQVTTVFGGTSMGPQISRLRAGVDIVVATPGRLIDLMERKAVLLDAVEVAVLDEADHMADLGFLPAVTQILDATPRKRQSLLFSATLDRGVDRLVARYLNDPKIHAVASASVPVAAMNHRVFVLHAEDKVAIAAEMAARPARTLFFVRTKHGADRLAKQLVKTGVDAAAIHGNLNQNQRLRALDAFMSGRSRVLVATDVAARGLHVDDLDLVVHYDPPNDHKDYVHRSGRTARAGASGTVVSLVDSSQASGVAKMQAVVSVHAQVDRVGIGSAAVREIAESGTPIEISGPALPARSPRAARPDRPARPARPGTPQRPPSSRRGTGHRSNRSGSPSVRS